MNKKSIILFATFTLLQSCAKVDNYMLGKDNTPKPKPLAAVENKVKLSQNKVLPIGSVTKKNSLSNIQPVVENNIIYSAASNGLIQAVNKKDAQSKWVSKTKAKIISGPVVGNDIVVVGTEQSNVIAFDKNSGQKKWQASLSSDPLAKPVIKKNKVLVKTIDGQLYAFNATNGKKDWVSHHGAPNFILKASSSPVVVDNVVLVGHSDGKLDAVDLKSGNLLWQRGIAYASGSSDVERLVDIDSTPVVRNGIAYIATYQGFVGAFSLKTGQFVWRKPASTYKDIVIDSKTLYLADSDDVVWAYNLENGKVRWKQDKLKARSLTKPVLINNKLALGDATGALHLLSTQSGEFLSRKQFNAPIYSSPTAHNNELYVLTSDGRLNELTVG